MILICGGEIIMTPLGWDLHSKECLDINSNVKLQLGELSPSRNQ